MTVTQAGDYQWWDNPEAVTVTVPRPLPLGTAQIDVEIAQRGNLDKRAQFFNGTQLTGKETLWRVPAALMEGVEITGQTKIRDDLGALWIVKTAVLVGTGNDPGHWECLTVKGK